MFQLFLLFMIIFLSTLFFNMNHPLSMGFVLMTQTLMTTLFLGSMNLNFWFSYSLFLVFMGGMLILFMYMTSLSSNEIFKFSLNWKIILMMMITVMFFFWLFFLLDLKNLIFFNKMKNLENYSIFFIKNFMSLDSLILNKMFNFPMNFVSIMLMNYLFLTLIASVKITNIFKGPLRPTI